VRRVEDSELGPGFVCLSQFLFDTDSRIANPAEEELARRFERTQRLHLNLFSIQSIAEVGDPRGLVGGPPSGLKLDQERPNVVVLPSPPRTRD
jgi:hypothetical protein